MLEDSGEAWPRVLADVRGEEAGPTLVAVVGIHGNEREAILAGRGFAEELIARPPQRGRVVVLVGNRLAVGAGERLIDRDLNRLWTEAHVRRARTGQPDPTGGAEAGEQRELLDHFDEVFRPGTGFGHALLDLHCFSGAGKPFSIATARPENLEVAAAIGLPLILGLQEALGGALTDYYDRHCTVALAIEGGRIGDPGSVERHLDVLRRTSVALGIADAARWALGPHPRREELPVYRISYRHPVRPEDEFRMLEGFASFDVVERQQLLAHDRGGEIRAPHDGVLLMPLYQDVGQDGFFLARLEAESLS